ncbi:putative oxidoreductase [Abditibacterium utsteinense]|uniref:Putative oxidoreductase n=1 Tax=Abditibacterium utsteinense TaxID=1960156 RepID=A0A2S8SQL2_9BACT|nr:aldo/keto reductase [Abditibacterium utsteinense]PQV63087.1 putative oxidoreductase [Abditibacterium utsteinense]
MKQRIFGLSGLSVGEIGLGGMPMSVGRDRPSEQDSIATIVRATERGMTLWDTADAYCIDDTETGHNERLFAKAKAALPSDLREKVVIATKAGHVRPEGQWVTDGRPEHLRAALDASLQALDTDCIDVWQFHRPDSKVPYADSIGVFAEAKRAGKVKFVGISNASAAQIEEATSIVEIVSVQNQFSPTHRAPERDGSLQKCRELGLAFLPWSPLGGMGGAKNIGEKGALATLAAELGISPQRVVLAWHLAKYELMIPIPGASRIESVSDSALGGDITLTPQQVATLDAAFI